MIDRPGVQNEAEPETGVAGTAVAINLPAFDTAAIRASMVTATSIPPPGGISLFRLQKKGRGQHNE
jgi:hypothetical protein